MMPYLFKRIYSYYSLIFFTSYSFMHRAYVNRKCSIIFPLLQSRRDSINSRISKASELFSHSFSTTGRSYLHGSFLIFRPTRRVSWVFLVRNLSCNYVLFAALFPARFQRTSFVFAKVRRLVSAKAVKLIPQTPFRHGIKHVWCLSNPTRVKLKMNIHIQFSQMSK